MSELVNIPNITLAQVGTWQASTGEVTFTTAMLQAAVDAFANDPAVKAPRMRFGHTDASATMAESAGGFDSQPCVGKFTNLRMSQDGQALMGDLVGVPAWLAEILPIAYPNRSIEAYHNVTTATGGQHEMVITSVALLGKELPAVETLEDLQVLFDGGSDEWINALTGGELIAASKEVVMPKRVNASLDVDDVAAAFYEQVATEESGRWWWWLVQIYLDPAVIICEDDYGDYWFVPYDPKTGVMGEEPVQVYIQWVETDSGKVAAAKNVKVTIPEEFGEADKVFASAADSRPAVRQQQFESNQTKEEDGMNPDLIKRLRELHGLTADQLPDDATEEKVTEVLDGIETPAPAEPPVEEPPAPEPTDTPEGTQASTAMVDRKVLQDMTDFVTKAKTKEKKDLIEGAVKAGKFPSSRAAHWSTLYDSDPDGTTEIINKLEKGLVPVDEIGSSEDRSSASTGQQGTGLFAELSKKEEVTA